MSRNPHAGALRHYRHKVKPDEREKLREQAEERLLPAELSPDDGA